MRPTYFTLLTGGRSDRGGFEKHAAARGHPVHCQYVFSCCCLLAASGPGPPPRPQLGPVGPTHAPVLRQAGSTSTDQ